MNTPRVSVVIRTYNRGYIVQRAITSVWKQTYRNREIIIVDDGSTDDTPLLAKRCLDDDLQYIRHPSNLGAAAAFNSGIVAAKGDLIAFLDSDDQWSIDKLTKQVSFFERHPEIDAVFSDVRVLGRRHSIPSLVNIMECFPSLLHDRDKRHEHVLTRRGMYLCLLQEIPIKPSALLLRRRVFDTVGFFNEAWKAGEDWEFLLRVSRSASFGYIDLPLTLQRRSPDSTLKKYWREDKLSLLELLRHETQILRGDSEATAAVRKGICRQCANLARYYSLRGHKSRSALIFFRGFSFTLNLEMLKSGIAALVGRPPRNNRRTPNGTLSPPQIGM